MCFIVLSAANVMDLHADVAEHYTQFHGRVKRAFKRNSRDLGQTSERANLLDSNAVSTQEESDSG